MRKANSELWRYSSRSEILARSEKIAERLPHFYRYWDNGSSISGLIAALGKRLDEAEREFVSIMRSHWVDTASGEDLDRLGALYNLNRKEGEPDSDFRNRLKTAIISYKGGGTIGAIQMLVRITLRLPQDYPVKIVENPPINLKNTWKVDADHEWFVNPRNIHEAVPDITISVNTENAKITNPTLMNITTGEAITFRGDVAYGDVLKISSGRAVLNDTDQTDKLSTTTIPKLPRRKSKWRYTEFIGANLGTFDQTQFDNSVFVIEIISTVTFEWTANQPANFELELPKEILMKAGITEKYMQEIVNSVKACGVKAEVKVI